MFWEGLAIAEAPFTLFALCFLVLGILGSYTRHY